MMHARNSTRQMQLCAGAKALRYLLKQTRKAHGVHRPVQIAHDGVAAWFSVTSGPISVHCMSREVREQLDLEELWGKGADLTWYQKGPGVLTLDTLGAGEEQEGDIDSRGEARHDG
jgi:ribosomal silencing factor RsfS